MTAHALDPDMELAVCLVCGGGEGSLPSECPGEKMSSQQSQRVYAGTLDFSAGHWQTRRVTGFVIRFPIGSWKDHTRLKRQNMEAQGLQLYSIIPLHAVDPYPTTRRQ